MTNNDILRRLRYALDLKGVTMAEIFKLSGHEIGPAEVLKFLKKEGEKGFMLCNDTVMASFLDGLIRYKRGTFDQKSSAAKPADSALTNNLILKKLRIALGLNDEDMIGILEKAGTHISKSELSALFRTIGHRNYKECGDQLLRNFVKGITLVYKNAGGSDSG
jgi:uncharacterized protein YehS (DUF1456 family)